MNPDDLHRRTTRNRMAAADLLAALDPPQWQMATLCEGWTVRHLAAHLVQPMLVGFGRFVLTSIRHRGDTAATVDHLTRRLARRPPAELVGLLRRHAGDRLDPPRVGPMGPFADSCLHLRDLARPLGLSTDVPPADWHLLLDYLAGPNPAPALVPKGRLDGLALRATDADWQHRGVPDDTPAEVAGPLEALALAVTGRPAALDDLAGPGRALLAKRLAGR